MAHHPGCGLRSVKIDRLAVKKQDLQILKNVSLTMHCGELTALIGKNGAGKTTLLKSILNETAHTGTVEYFDDAGHIMKAPKIGYVPQNLSIDKNAPVSVSDLFCAGMSYRPVFLGTHHARKKTLELLEMVECSSLIDRRLGHLSGGELQRVMLAFALNPIPPLLLLDEPMTGVDKKGLDMFYELVTRLLSEHHMSILMVSHDLRLVAKYATRVAFLDGGEITVCGTPQEVFSNTDVLEAFGRVLEHN